MQLIGPGLGSQAYVRINTGSSFRTMTEVKPERLADTSILSPGLSSHISHWASPRWRGRTSPRPSPGPRRSLRTQRYLFESHSHQVALLPALRAHALAADSQLRRGLAITRSIFQDSTSFNSRRLEGLLSSDMTSVRAAPSGSATDQLFFLREPRRLDCLQNMSRSARSRPEYSKLSNPGVISPGGRGVTALEASENPLRRA